jgi:predicted enzyme related to lactoylglutathione lyase
MAGEIVHVGWPPVPGHGWFARCRDSEGNAFHLWQSDSSAG